MADPDVPKPRLFLALWPDTAARQSLADWRDRWTWPTGATPTLTANLHLTLHFLGPVAVDHLPELAGALELPVDAFTLDFGRAELWPGGISVVCPLAEPEPMLRLRAALAVVVRRLALPLEERPFRPHVTLARKARHATVPPDGPALAWHVADGFALVQSMPAGQAYRVLQRYGTSRC